MDRVLCGEHLHGVLSYVCIDTDFFILYAFPGGDPDLPQKGSGKGIFHLGLYRGGCVLPLAGGNLQAVHPADAL